MTWFEQFIDWLYNKQYIRRQERLIKKTALPMNIGAVSIKRLVTNMQLSETGLNLIKQFEGYRTNPYQDQAGVWTIGYGTTGKYIHKNTPPMTEIEAESHMRKHIELLEKDIRQLVKVPLNQNQFDALISFAYNVGTDIDADTTVEGLGDSTLLRKLNRGYYNVAAGEFLRWVYAGGKKRKGLQIRRKKEHDLFLT